MLLFKTIIKHINKGLFIVQSRFVANLLKDGFKLPFDPFRNARKAINKAFYRLYGVNTFVHFTDSMLISLRYKFSINIRKVNRIDRMLDSLWTLILPLLERNSLLGQHVYKLVKTLAQNAVFYGVTPNTKEIYSRLKNLGINFNIYPIYGRRVARKLNKLAQLLEIILIELARNSKTITPSTKRLSRLYRGILALGYLHVAELTANMQSISGRYAGNLRALSEMKESLTAWVKVKHFCFDLSSLALSMTPFNWGSLSKAVPLSTELRKILKELNLPIFTQHLIASRIWLQTAHAVRFITYISGFLPEYILKQLNAIKRLVNDKKALKAILPRGLLFDSEVLTTLSKWIKRELINFPYGLRLSSFRDGTGKVRTIAIANATLQGLLKPIHDLRMKYLKSLPNDYTFDQLRILETYKKWTSKRIVNLYRFDLSNATDLIPVTLLSSFFTDANDGKAFVDALRADKYLHPRGTGSIRYNTGQGMGLYGSWALGLALVHHGVIGILIEKLGLKEGSSPLYAVLGDDVIIANAKLAIAYKEAMTRLGIPINMTKSITPSNHIKYGLEFAKILMLRGKILNTRSIGAENVSSFAEWLISSIRLRSINIKPLNLVVQKSLEWYLINITSQWDLARIIAGHSKMWLQGTDILYHASKAWNVVKSNHMNILVHPDWIPEWLSLGDVNLATAKKYIQNRIVPIAGFFELSILNKIDSAPGNESLILKSWEVNPITRLDTSIEVPEELKSFIRSLVGGRSNVKGNIFGRSRVHVSTIRALIDSTAVIGPGLIKKLVRKHNFKIRGA